MEKCGKVTFGGTVELGPQMWTQMRLPAKSPLLHVACHACLRHTLAIATTTSLYIPTLKMSAAQNSAGIQTLLDLTHPPGRARCTEDSPASKRMYTCLARPRHDTHLIDPDRTKRVKDARNEAQKEIEDYKKEKEDEYQKFEKEHSSGNQKAEEDAKKDTDVKVKEIEEIGKKTGSKVVDQLLAAVTNAKSEPPKGRE
ncbi:hypothetical protein EK21DRAFT_86580 [Setomelanomma holmii]|uniref:V-type proton ATPase subunit G n=1 Tax=Setomelanomma holmii TaxID=210430 RepID=A0A9P4LQE2_9PLEO|nr:hypothetical protein EK21DRAFT_86580 [Setomelanomma holmii]